MANDPLNNNVPINRPAPPPPPKVPAVPPPRKPTGAITGLPTPLPPARPTPVAALPKPDPSVPPPTPATVPSIAALPPTPVPPPPVAAATVDTDQVVVRTMRDDINDTKPGKAAPRAAPASPAPTPLPSAPLLPPASTFPLPPRATDQSTKTVSAPAVRRQHSKVLRWAIISLAAVLVLGGGGAAAWFFVVRDRLPENSPQHPVAAASAVLPADYLMLVRYQLSGVAERSAVSSAWQTARGGTVTTRELLAGDPRLLLADPELTEMYYVLLEASTDPFVVVPKTALTTQHLVTSNSARLVERDGWYIAHAAAVEPYEAALAQGTLQTAGTPFSPLPENAPLQLHLGAGMLPTIRTGLVSSDFVAGQLQAATIAITVGAQPHVLQLAGLADYFSPPATTPTNQELLSYVPGSATAVRLGANFKNDVAAWLAGATALDSNIVQRPVVKQLLDQLTTPYAVLTFAPTGARKPALGLIIEIPPSLQGKITLQESALEQAVPALIPLILDRRTVAPVSFTEVAFRETPLRYANISGTMAALDYAVTDKHIIIATTKDSMLALLENVVGTPPVTPVPTVWDVLLTTWGALPAAHDIVIGKLSTPALLKLLPTAPDTALPFGVAFMAAPEAAGNHATLNGIMTTVPAALPSPTPQP